MFLGIDIYGGITLNNTVGGLNPMAVAVAIENGARVVWFPTWSAKNDIEKGGYSHRVASVYGKVPPPYLTVLDAEGRLLPEVIEIISSIAKHDVALATGHLSIEESKVLIRSARELGIKRIVFTHALTRMVGASLEEQKEIAAMGAFIEHCFVATMPMHQQLPAEKIAESIKVVGAERCIISSDAVFFWNPTPPKLMRIFIATLAEYGITPEEINWMARHNPGRLLGMRKE
jgi:hypothetical protein